MTRAEAESVGRWAYEGPWSVYNGRAIDIGLVSAENGYHAIVEEVTGAFLGYVCLGPEARVPGLVERSDVIDVGVGLDPTVVGQGRGGSILSPVVEWIDSRHPGIDQRAVVQSWNERSLRLCERLGFEVVGHHMVDQGGELVDYVVLRRPASHVTARCH